MIRRALTAALMIAVLAATVLVAGAQDASANSGQVLQLVNAQRARAGCAPLKVNGHLQIAAQRHSQEMASLNRFSHTGANGASPQRRARAIGYGAGVGENIAAGQRTPQQVVNAWMASPGHRRNILNCRYRSTGIGTAHGGTYGVYWTQKFGTV